MLVAFKVNVTRCWEGFYEHNICILNISKSCCCWSLNAILFALHFQTTFQSCSSNRISCSCVAGYNGETVCQTKTLIFFNQRSVQKLDFFICIDTDPVITLLVFVKRSIFKKKLVFTRSGLYRDCIVGFNRTSIQICQDCSCGAFA